MCLNTIKLDEEDFKACLNLFDMFYKAQDLYL